MMEQQETFYNWKSALQSKGLKVNLVKTKIIVSKIWHITVKPSSKNVPCGICGRKQLKMQYYVNLAQLGYMEDVQRLKG